MFKKHMRKKQYAKIKSYIESSITFIQELIDNISDDEVDEMNGMNTVKACRIAQKVILKEVLHFIENEEKS